jgi:hypothetical protein
MDDLLKAILQTAGEWDDREAARHATLQLWMLLEMHNLPASYMQEEYETVLPLDVRQLPFNDEEQSDLVAGICELVALAPNPSGRLSWLSVLSAALPWVALEPALRLLVDRPGLVWRDDDLRQLLVALDHMLGYVWMKEDDPRLPHLRKLSEIIDRLQPIPLVSELAAGDNPEVADVAASVRKKLEYAIISAR